MTTKEKSREYQKEYRERNKEKIRERNREQAQRYRDSVSQLSFIEKIKNAESFWARVAILDSNSCWEWQGPKHEKGYGLYSPMHGVTARAHRVAYALHNGHIDDELYVCHRCDNPGCVNPSHLFLGTAKDNSDDKSKKGRSSRLVGETNPTSKLTKSAVRAIYADRRTNREIAQDYGVDRSLVSQIRRRKIWKEATSDLPEQPKRKPGSGSSAVVERT